MSTAQEAGTSFKSWRVNTAQSTRREEVGSEYPTCTRHGHRHRVTATRGCIDTICLS